VPAAPALSVAPSPAVAPPPGNPRFPLFDSLRAIAVLAVLTFHVCLVSGALNRRITGDVAGVLGAQGPILFFAISGFLLYRPWVTSPPRVGRYARRRALRILPGYWVALTALAIFPGITGVFTGDWWRYYGFLQLYSQDTISHGIPVAWTLCVEVTFYIALPLWALTVGRLGVRAQLAALGALALAGAGVQVAALRLEVSHLVAQSLVGQCTWMAIGMALAVVSVAAPPRLTAMLRDHGGMCWAGAVAAFVGLALLRDHGGGLLGIIRALQTRQPYPRALADVALTALLTALVLVPAVFAGRGLPHRVLAWAPLAWIGLVSYGIFLWHLTIAELLALPAAPGQFSADGLDLAARIPFAVTPVLFVLTLAASCAVAAASYRYVELPFLRLKDRRR
jgi:peptidoglycan/LPS O-acetylase OafA/YrhL